METKQLKKFKIFSLVITILLLINMVFTGILLGSYFSKKNEKTKYTLYIGTNDKDTYKMEKTYEECVSEVGKVCMKYTDGYTIYEANGYWKDEKSNITVEKTIACILEDIEKEKVYKICDEIIVSLNQYSILIETCNVMNAYYSTTK